MRVKMRVSHHLPLPSGRCWTLRAGDYFNLLKADADPLVKANIAYDPEMDEKERLDALIVETLRDLARDGGLDLDGITATGKGGTLTKGNIVGALMDALNHPSVSCPVALAWLKED